MPRQPRESRLEGLEPSPPSTLVTTTQATLTGKTIDETDVADIDDIPAHTVNKGRSCMEDRKVAAQHSGQTALNAWSAGQDILVAWDMTASSDTMRLTRPSATIYR
ncbi:hypothetical protein [Natronosalvus amylolyticus]|uniref:hypothetical protein n=1 Tax=Natronosalvus amylolyticus TaxID=2961994 RepID=UPI0020C95819|nr:hypothetical protein [Natronosalvus amylolyticus]